MLADSDRGLARLRVTEHWTGAVPAPRTAICAFISLICAIRSVCDFCICANCALSSSIFFC